MLDIFLGNACYFRWATRTTTKTGTGTRASPCCCFLPPAVCSFIVNLLTAVALWKVDCKFHFNSISGLDYNPRRIRQRVDWGPGVKGI